MMEPGIVRQFDLLADSLEKTLSTFKEITDFQRTVWETINAQQRSLDQTVSQLESLAQALKDFQKRYEELS